MKGHQQQEEAKPAIILPGHQYTPENFSADALKLNDRPKAEALRRAAEKAGYYSKLCLVTSFLSGVPAGGEGYGYDDDDVDDSEMGEVYDERLEIEHWAADGIPPLSYTGFEEEDLIATSPLNAGEPIDKDSNGYMGNTGPDLMHWYHYGVVMIWAREISAGKRRKTFSCAARPSLLRLISRRSMLRTGSK